MIRSEAIFMATGITIVLWQKGVLGNSHGIFCYGVCNHCTR
ncbi:MULTISPECIES: hypothetical protein [Ehrlichia]|uniref:Uncharacterized protein n=1 Tax=Ehrlichia cf. muris str. EmCRT TaxID=1359167 RepID=A0A0F3NBN9_9RICK|nr:MULTISPECIES: hypothetical protein [Ehrlichia]KJV65513.1 hypothetical protein EMUCRT_0457 [Ehrlichia cf. muris str. EmCRT]